MAMLSNGPFFPFSRPTKPSRRRSEAASPAAPLLLPDNTITPKGKPIFFLSAVGTLVRVLGSELLDALVNSYVSLHT